MHFSPSVLVVDDDPTHRKMMEMVADVLNIRPTIVVSAEEALETFLTREFDLILMDWRLPEMDGCECAHEIRRLESAQNRAVSTPIIAVTGKVMPGDREFCLASGMDDYLAKPFALEDMQSLIEKWTRYRKPAEGRSHSAQPSNGL